VHYLDIVPGNVEVTGSRVYAGGFRSRAWGITLDQSAPLPVLAADFDVASSHGVLHHIHDPMPVLKEFRRVLKSGGLLYVMLYTEYLEHRCGPKIGALVRERGVSPEEAFAWCTDDVGAPYARSYTEAEGVRLLATAGFAEIVVTAVYNNDDFRTFRAVAP
jgi:SAM-dependent methyltransferase